MTFNEVLSKTIAMLHEHGRVSYRALKRQFALQDDYLEDLKDAVLFAHPEVRDEEGRGLVWMGDTGTASSAASAPVESPGQAPLAYTPSYLAEKILTSRSALEGERKQVTVLFADLKGSMELLADRDPEEARQLLDPVLERMMVAVHRYEGTVNQVMGDGIMALFGAPLAHEDHAVRACYAALAMQAAIGQYADELRRQHGLDVQIRVGLNAGEVVVRAIGNDLRMDYTAVGQTTHLAARMEQMAMPGAILITPAVLGLVEGFVQVRALGALPVRGLHDPVEVYEVTGAGVVRSRLQAAAARGLTRFVGRQPELETLQQALVQAQAGHGQVVAMVGEAGVGKSRLLYEFGHSHHTQGWLILESAAVSYGKATPYFPVVDLLKRYCHVEERDDPRTIRAKVTGQILTLDETLHGTIPALLLLLDALPEDSPFVQLDPPQRRQRTLEALKRVLLCESHAQPLLLLFEDLHWIDSETQALLDSLVERLPTARVVLLVTYRPEYQHGWGSKTSYTQLRLDPLPPASADALVQALLGDDPSLALLTRHLITRTEGNPFFLEESLRALVETGVLAGEPGTYRLVQALPTIQVPATVQAVLAARMDRLPPEDKRLLQTAAVIGTEVPFTLLQAMTDMPEEALQRGLAHLQAAEFLYETRLFPDHAYTFKHALTHEVAYGSLLYERRRVLHAQIVEALERLSPDRLAEQIERLALHALRGEVWSKAVAYWRQAGTRALSRWANREAGTCFEQALAAVQYLPEQRDTVEQAIDLRFDLRNVLMRLGEDYDRALICLREAETLAHTLDDRGRLGQVAAFLTYHGNLTGHYHQAVVSGQQTLAHADTLGDFALQVQGHFYLGQAYHCLGDYPRAIALLRRNVASLTDERLYGSFGTAGLLAVTSRFRLACCLTELGVFAEAITLGEEAVQIAEAVHHPGMLANACYIAPMAYLRKGDFPQAIPLLQRGVELCRSGPYPRLFAGLAASLGMAYALTGHAGEALRLLEEAMEPAVLQHAVPVSAPLLWVSEAYGRLGRGEDARQCAGRAIEHARDHHERGYQAWALWLLSASVAGHTPPEVESAATAYRLALGLAEELGMRPLQAHCYRGLGTLYATSGQREQARAALTTAIAMYQSMEMTFWLPQTESVLAQVDAQ